MNIQKLKYLFFKRLRNNNSGIILIVVLGVLLILSVLAVSLGRTTQIDLALAKHSIAKVKSKFLAFAGIQFAFEQLQQDLKNDEYKNIDTFYRCGLALPEDVAPQEVFGLLQLDSGKVDISYLQAASQKFENTNQSLDEFNSDQDSMEMIIDSQNYYINKYPGYEDEERKLNLNALSKDNVKVFIELLKILDVDEQQANEVAYSLLDWKDADSVKSSSNYGAENDYYESQSPSYLTKNFNIESYAELLLIRSLDSEVLKKIKPFITIFPKDSTLKLNFDTANKPVLKAFTRGFVGSATNTEVSDADALVEKIMAFRNGEDSIEFTSDDRSVDHSNLDLNAKEQVLFLVLNQFRIKESNFFHIRSQGVEKSLNVKSAIDVVVDRKNFEVVYWNSN